MVKIKIKSQVVGIQKKTWLISVVRSHVARILYKISDSLHH